MTATVTTPDDLVPLSNAVADLQARVTKLEQAAPPQPVSTPDNTWITKATDPAIVDDWQNAYTLVATAGKGLQIAKNAVIDPPTQNVAKLGILHRKVHQENAQGGWWVDTATGQTNATAWSPESDPTAPPPSGAFKVSNGQLLGPDGNLFKMKGVNICSVRVWGDKGVEHTRITRAKLQALYPKFNFIRYAHWAGFLLDPTDPSIMAWVNDMTSNGIVVMFDLHYTGEAISPSDATANNWLAKVATTYKNNPLVWGQSQNEPHGAGSAISAMMKGQYNAWRSTGNTAPFVSCCGDPGGELTGMTPSDFAGMTDFLFDLHYYGWMPSNGMSYQSCVNQLAGFRSQDGAIPVGCLEYGDSTDGNVIDGNWQTVCQQALAWPQGSAAWMVNWWSFTGSQGDSLVTDYNLDARTTPYGDYVNAGFG